ncbi:type IV pilus assembly protein PilY1 [Nitrosomonas aestuarii]|uniref:Type IV pilus assembly protein PilY1 n=1 Tax=Nitrosomonas aestuarii TaxID=52441 RepID=A0A1I4FAD7_9PROT|nr:PilC/PilY family type IV pilus protein [Nitrosomonas aestuarii]SFL13837.1 type IV pilus assembly protein PilY1 [Nitrosomonas aestuarii]
MKESLIRPLVLVCFFLIPLFFASQTRALPPLSNGPLFLGGNISPNVMFTLDDSGSMHFEIMPDELILQSVRYMFPRANDVYGPSDYSNYVVDFDPSNNYTASLRSSNVNKIYYNPTIRYLPWSNADGSLMSNASPACAPHNPMNTGAGCRNLTVNNTQSASWLKSNGSRTNTQSKTFYPAVYFKYNGGNVNSASSYTQVEIKSSTSSYVGGSGRVDCVAAPTCTYNEEIQNFANWYTYYRSRILLARAGIGRAFATQGNTMRVGFAAINKNSSTIDGVSTAVIKSGVRQFTGTDRTNFFNNLYDHDIPAAGTPLREAMISVGEYFKRTDDKGPWGQSPGSNGGTQHACRQNYNILMTDGYWTEGSVSGLDNSDNQSGSSITNHSSPAVPATYTYTPSLPYADAYSDTLADAAMKYWKNDLRTDLPNNVPTNPSDPAFWQHMVTFTVGLGVSGSLNALPSGSESWPNPTASDAAKIDDLWHAAVNSRGDFFSAADPNTFADALSNTLSTIIARTGSASAVAANSNSLMTNGRIYQAKFNSGDWSGQLLSVPIDANGTLGATEWEAGSVSLAPASVNPVTRVVLTKGNTDGVAFEYANLTTAQKNLLDKNAAGSVDNCGPERITFLRGGSTHEGAGGTFSCASASTVNKFRTRTTSKLGDIVNSGPFYVGKPSAGYSDVDHPGYAAFSAAFKNRLPIVYVGANDGVLHGFNACIPGVTPGCSAADAGKELITYIPSMVYDNLSRLTDKDYHSGHRYFVDGSPMVADAYIGVTASWKSVLIGSLNGGGKGFYALDVTNPSDTSQSAPTFTAANAANLVLWEFSDADDVDMGYSYNQPPVNPFTGQAKQIVKMKNGQWAVVVGNGYNSNNGKAVLYILFLTGGEDGSWTLGTDYIKLVASTGSGNGLSTPVPFDSDGDGSVDVIYAGDIKGNVWKFDVSSAAPSSWNVAIGGLPLFTSGTGKPIIAPPVISLHPNGGQLVLFGTGKYLETGDTTNTDVQTIYAVWDHNTSTTVNVGELVQQVITDASVRTATQNPVSYSATTKGWYFDLPVSGERLTGIPGLEDGLFTFATIIPSTSPCDFGGRGFVNTVDFFTGGMLPFPAFDINRNGIIGFNDGLSAGVEIGFSVGGVTRIRGHLDDVLISSRADGTLVKTPATKGPAGLRGRITWRELIQ